MSWFVPAFVVTLLPNIQQSKFDYCMPFTLREPLRTTLDLTPTQHVPLTLQWSVRYRCSKDANRIRPFPEQVQLLPSLGGQDPYQAFHLSLWVSESNNTHLGLYVQGDTPDQSHMCQLPCMTSV